LSKRLFIKTWGCQMNVYDSDRMADVLAPLGFRPVEDAEDADMVVLNTCHIRERASEKVFSELGRLRALKDRKAEAGGTMTIVVAGCTAQAEGAEIVRRAPHVDMVVGPQAYHTLPGMIRRAEIASGAQVAIEFPEIPKFDSPLVEAAERGPSAFLAVQEGCDKFCSYCVVPHTRGPEYSRSVAQVFAEAERLVAGGTREITLLGQNVDAYHGEGPDGEVWSLARLIRRLAEIDGLERLRYTTSHPRDFKDDLIAAHADVPKLMPYLHLPIQSGSDKTLRAMNRGHTVAWYRKRVEKLWAARPDLALSGDFIVGFPGETDEDFEQTLALADEIRYAQAYSFKYSARPGTPAAEIADQVPEKVKEERLARLQARVEFHQAAFNKASIGTTTPVLFDRIGKRDGQLMGRTPGNQSIHVVAPARLLGKIVDVRVESATTNSLGGSVVTTETTTAEAAE